MGAGDQAAQNEAIAQNDIIKNARNSKISSLPPNAANAAQQNLIEKIMIEEEKKLEIQKRREAEMHRESAGDSKLLEGAQIDEYWKRKVVGSLKRWGGEENQPQ